MRVGFAEVDITPSLGISKIGWIKDIKADTLLDPLYAHVAVFESEGERIGFVQLDLLWIRWSDTDALRRRIEKEYGFPGAHVMVSATHNHAGPAIANAGVVRQDEAYTAATLDKLVGAFGVAVENLQDAEVGLGSCFEFGISQNRRVVMRDGTVRTHGNFDDPDALCLEGPIDPEVSVVAARDLKGNLLGCLINFACHPTHHGGTTELSAGFPGVLADAMKENDCPVTLFLNGACGNIHTARPEKGGQDTPMDVAGRTLAEDALRVIEGMEFRSNVRMASTSTTVDVPYREPTDDQIKGTARGAQRFVDPSLYDQLIPGIVERIRECGTHPAEVQVHFMDEVAFAAIPAEYFVQHGLRIKQEAHPRHALVVGYANGNLGYIPHGEAFERGGYETTFGPSSCMAPKAGALLADAAVGLIRSHEGCQSQA